jgi:hypothetical protein
MTVSSSTNKASYNGNGSTTVFAYNFKIFDQDDLTVIIRSATGVETVKTITTDYTVSGVGNDGGGNVTMGTAPASGETITILREQDLVQELDLVPNDPFPANLMEDALDRLTFMVQQHDEELARSIKASKTNTITSTEFTVLAADRANKVFAFDSSGELAVTQELGTYRGNWATSTAFAQRDIVKDTSNNNIYICLVAHTSTGAQPITSNADVAKWALLVDAASATTSASAAASSASAAATSATNAANSASAASTSAGNAATSESNASTSASAAATSATNASNSATAAAGSATTASNAATAAGNAQTAAEAAQTAAETAETNAETAETNAANSASAASTSRPTQHLLRRLHRPRPATRRQARPTQATPLLLLPPRPAMRQRLRPMRQTARVLRLDRLPLRPTLLLRQRLRLTASMIATLAPRQAIPRSTMMATRWCLARCISTAQQTRCGFTTGPTGYLLRRLVACRF